MQILDKTPSPFALQGWPVFRLGFRPFYLGTALLACLSVPLWVAMFLGHVRFALPMPGVLWHGHEMLFGFAAGVVAGFLLTAVKAWNRPAYAPGATACRSGAALAGGAGGAVRCALSGVCGD